MGMYIDGHERVDVVAYRQAFVYHRWAEYEVRIPIFGRQRESPSPRPSNSRPFFNLILVTHNESTFFR